MSIASTKHTHHIGRKVVVVGLVAALIGGFVAAIHFVASPYIAMSNYAIGAGVSVTGSEMPRNIKAVTSRVKLPATANFQQLGQPIQVTPGGTLPAPLALQFRLSQRVKPGELVELETSESPSGPWSLVPGTVSSDGWSVSVQTVHLSWWLPVLLNIAQTVLDVESQMANDATGNLFAPMPKLTCDNSTQAKQGYIVSASSTKALAWCMGIESGQRVLKIVNRMRYPLYVQYPGLTLISTPGWSASLMARFDDIEYQGKEPSTFLAPLEEADFNVGVATGSAAYINTMFDIDAQMLSMAVIAVTTAAAFLTANGAGEGALTSDLAAEAPTGPTSPSASQNTFKTISTLLNYAPCVNAITKQSFTAFLSECLSAAALSDGVLSFAHAQLVSTIMTASGLIEFVISTMNGLVDSLTQNDRFIIYLAVPKSTPGPAPSTLIPSPSPPSPAPQPNPTDTPTPTPAPPPGPSWHLALSEAAPSCNIPSTERWYAPLQDPPNVNCASNGFLQQQDSPTARNYGETDLQYFTNYPTYDQSNFQASLTAAFQNPGDTDTYAAIIVQTPRAKGVLGGYIFGVNSQGCWQLNFVNTVGQFTHEGNWYCVGASNAPQIGVQVQNGTLTGYINKQAVISWPDSLGTANTEEMGIMTEKAGVQYSSLVAYTSFQFSLWY